MTTIYVFKLNEDKFYISDFNNDIINSIHQMIGKLIQDKQSDNYKNLFVQNLGTAISTIDWIKKYPVESIVETKENISSESLTYQYMKKYGIDNVRSDLYKEINFTEGELIFIKDVLNYYDEPVKERIKKLDIEINKLKTIFDAITNNNAIVLRYLNYDISQIINNPIPNQEFKLIKSEQQQKLNYELEKLKKQGVTMLYHTEQYKQIIQQIGSCDHINLLTPNFINSYINKYNFKDVRIRISLENTFLNYKIIEEIANALFLKKTNETLISNYGTLDEINKKISSMLYRKIELLHELDDIKPDDIILEHIIINGTKILKVNNEF
jgi:hypothetical protein